MYRLALLVPLAGCLALVPRLNGGSAADSSSSSSSASSSSPSSDSTGIHHIMIGRESARVGPYWGPDCERVGDSPSKAYQREPEPSMGKQPNLADPLPDQLLRLVCVEAILAAGDEPGRNTWVMQHFRFDELYFDHVTAAMMLVECLEASSCLFERNRAAASVNDPAMQRRANEGRERGLAVTRYEVGMMRWYADHVDRGKVAERLAATTLPKPAQDAFLALLDRAKSAVVTATDGFTPDQKRVLVELPASVFAAHAHAREGAKRVLDQLAPLVERVRAARAGGKADDDLVGQLDRLRIAYVTGCAHGHDCTHDAVFAAITTQLFWAYITRDDAPAARAESKLLVHLAPTSAEDIGEQQAKAIDDAIGRGRHATSARDQGFGADGAGSTGAGASWGDGRYVYRPTEEAKINWDAMIPGGEQLAHVDAVVASVARNGDQVVVRFQDSVGYESWGTGCHETDRIDRIDSDGHISYRSECTGTQSQAVRTKVAPMTFPVAEMSGIGPGDEVAGFSRLGADQSRIGGRVWFVKRGQRVARVRDVPL